MATALTTSAPVPKKTSDHPGADGGAGGGRRAAERGPRPGPRAGPTHEGRERGGAHLAARGHRPRGPGWDPLVAGAVVMSAADLWGVGGGGRLSEGGDS